MAILLEGRERERVSSLLGMKKNEEEPGGEREKKREASGGEGGFAPKKRVTRHVILALPLLFVAPGARARYTRVRVRREDIQRSAGREHTPTYDGPSNDILLARLVTPHLPTRCLSLPFLLLPACLPPCFSLFFSLSLSLSLSHNALSWSAFPCGWIAARGYVRNCGTKSAEELTVHCGGHKTLLILIDSISGNRWLEVMTRLYSSYRKLINH